MEFKDFAVMLDPCPEEPRAVLAEAVRALAGEHIDLQGPYQLSLQYHDAYVEPPVDADPLDLPIYDEQDPMHSKVELRFRLFGTVAEGTLAEFLVLAGDTLEQMPFTAQVVARNRDLRGVLTEPDFSRADAPTRLRESVLWQ